MALLIFHRKSDEETEMSDKVGSGTVLPTPNKQPRYTGGDGYVSINGTVAKGTNIGNGRVQTPDGKIHKNG